jgi:hypothetical protein
MPRARKQQRYPDSCGAASLLCAAIELGLTNLPDLGHGPLPAYLSNFNPLALSNQGWDGRALQTTDQCETAIYYVTSGRTLRGYSLPSAISRAALALGLRVTAYLGTFWRRPFSLPGLTAAYPNEIADVRNLGINIHSRAFMYLKTNQRALSVLVRTGRRGGGLHYVMRRPGGSFMDPDTGADHSWWTFIHHRRPVTGAAIPTTYTGVSLVLSR